MKRTLLILAVVALSGCHGLQRLIDGPTSPMPDQGNINPNDYYVTGTTTKDHQSVYLNVTKRTITVEIYKNGQWVKLERPDPYDYYDSYQVFTIPQGGVYFGDLAFTNSTGGITIETGTPSAPTGTQYRIHTVAQ